MRIVCTILQIISLTMLAWIVLSYVVAFGRIPWGHPIRSIYDALSRFFEPVLRPIRAVVPPVRMGGAALDLSPMILIVGIWVLSAIIC